MQTLLSGVFFGMQYAKVLLRNQKYCWPMTEHQKESAFLKDLLRGEDNEICTRLHSQIIKSEENEKCVRCALFTVTTMGLLSLAGVGYSAVLLPDFFNNATPFLVRLFTALTLACVLCLSVYVSLWFSYRATTNQLLGEVRRFVLASTQSKHLTTFTTVVSVQKRDTAVIRLQTAETSEAEPQFPLSKAS